MIETIERIKRMDLWRGPVEPLYVPGGITNSNFVVQDGGGRYFVRVGEDIPVHGVMRFNEVAASRAAHAAGLSPRVVHHEAGILVLDFIPGETLDEKAVRDPVNLGRILSLVKACHHDVPLHYRGPALMFWVFQVVRNYAAVLREVGSRMVPLLPDLERQAGLLERAAGKVAIVFGHNDLLPANFIDDGERLWLIDYDYAGFNSPLFDLGGLASNNGLDAAQEKWMIEEYFDRPVTEPLWLSYQSMKCASLLRESMWSMVSEHYSDLDFDYRAYTGENLARYEQAMKTFEEIRRG